MSKKLNATSYNAIVETWATYRDQTEPSTLVQGLAKRLPQNAAILDVGCGTGYPIASFLVSEGFQVTGIDIAKEMLAKARALKLKKARFRQTDLFHFETDETFQAIIAWDSFFHFPYRQQRLIYPTVGKLIAEGGYLLFTHGTKDNHHTNPMYGHDFYYSSLDKAEVHQLLHDNGFKVIYALEDYYENDMHRSYVVLAQKITK